MRQRIAFCTSRDGTKIAYARHGSGPPLVRSGHWLTHVERDWLGPVWRPQLEDLGERFTVTRYDCRDTGLSDRGVGRVSLAAWVEDLEAVVDASGLDRFPLLGINQGGPISIAYAASHPERVSALVLCGTYALGRDRRVVGTRQETQATATLMTFSWGEENAAVQQLWTARMMPSGTPEQMRWLTEAQRRSMSGPAAVRSYLVCSEIDVTTQARAVRAPTLVLHARGDSIVPFDAGRELAAMIDGAHFVPLDSPNHLLRTDEPAWAETLGEVDAFLGEEAPASPRLPTLTQREHELAELLAAGLDNAAIADRLVISPKTVRNHITHVFDKLGVDSRAQAIVVAREAGLGVRVGG